MDETAVANERAGKELKIIYRNWRGEIRERRVWPMKVWRGSTEWHDGDQWLLQAQDEETGAIRDFAMNDIIRIG